MLDGVDCARWALVDLVGLCVLISVLREGIIVSLFLLLLNAILSSFLFLLLLQLLLLLLENLDLRIDRRDVASFYGLGSHEAASVD